MKNIKENDILITIKEYLIHKSNNSKNGKNKGIIWDLNFVKLSEIKKDIIKERKDNLYYIVHEYYLWN